jgi:23S rRNA (uracil1939-C5)-methyltransferase
VYLQPGGVASVECLHPAGPVEPLRYGLPEFDLQIRFDPVGFVQVNAGINRRMVHRAVELLAPARGDRVLDLYCGIGNFSLPLARRAGEVIGVDGDAALVRAAAANARHNGLGNVAFRQADLDAIDGSEQWFAAGCDLLLLDPARNGAAAVARHVGVAAPRRIVYVSCHPGTLARDAAVLVHEQGYRCDAAGIIDMFPHTAHVESIAVFSK